MQLTAEQQKAVRSLVEGIKKHDKKEQTLGGLAGTGKTELIKYLKKVFPNYAVAAYTGKAANVLRRRGIKASTIHSLIYEPRQEGGKVHFLLKGGLDHDGIIIDEASMVSRDIYEDLQSFGLPMIFIGDHGQLEPIGDDFNLMNNPEYKLETIHRNAGEIAYFARWLRQGNPWYSFKGPGNQVQFVKWKTLTTQTLLGVDQVIAAYNRTRVDLNNEMRRGLGYSGILNNGEKVICLRNNKKEGLFNGMQGEVTDVHSENVGKFGKQKHYMDFMSEDQLYTEIRFDPNQFGKEKSDKEYYNVEMPNPFDYAYCITTHKSQGDEWDRVAVIEEKNNRWDHRRWAYTAASRAKEYLLWVTK